MRMWEIREGDYQQKHRGDYYGRHKSSEKDEVEEAEECGFEDGYKEAMKEIEGHHAYNRMRRY